MKVGISSACLYPLETEKAVKQLAEINIEYMEIFLNCPSELKPSFIAKLESIIRPDNIRITSIHPFTSGMEGYLFFSNYERRFKDGLKLYENYFRVCKKLNCNVLVMHGGNKDMKLSDSEYFEKYAKIYQYAKKFGIKIAHENVERSKTRSADFIRNMRKYLDDQVSFVLDVKQCIRAGESVYEMLAAMGQCVEIIHISDNDCQNSCMSIGKGSFDFKQLNTELNKIKYDNFIILELYRENFADIAELQKCSRILREIFV